MRSHAVGIAGMTMFAYAAAATPATITPGEWKLADRAAGLSAITVAFLTDTMPGAQPNNALLAIRCMSGQTTVEITWGGRTKRTNHPVSISVDDLPPWQETWTADDETKTLVGLRENRSAIEFLNRIFPSEVLTLQLRGNYRPYVFSFKMAKAEPHLRAIANRCGWTLQ